MRLRLLSTRPVPLSKMESNIAQPHIVDQAAGLKLWQWNQSFMIDVRDGNKSQLEITLWDADEAFGTEAAFMGEVILNVAKLLPYANQHIEQDFNIKQGRHYTSTQVSASGILSLHLIFTPQETGGGTAETAQSALEASVDSVVKESNAPLPSSSVSPIVASSAPVSNVMESQIGTTEVEPTEEAKSKSDSGSRSEEETFGPADEDSKNMNPAQTASLIIEKLSGLAMEENILQPDAKGREPSNGPVLPGPASAPKFAPADRRPPAVAPSMSVRDLEKRHLVSHSPLSSSDKSLVKAEAESDIPAAPIVAQSLPTLLQAPPPPPEIADQSILVIPDIILRKIVSFDQSSITQDNLFQANVPSVIMSRTVASGSPPAKPQSGGAAGHKSPGIDISKVPLSEGVLRAEAGGQTAQSIADMDVDGPSSRGFEEGAPIMAGLGSAPMELGKGGSKGEGRRRRKKAVKTSARRSVQLPADIEAQPDLPKRRQQQQMETQSEAPRQPAPTPTVTRAAVAAATAGSTKPSFSGNPPRTPPSPRSQRHGYNGVQVGRPVQGDLQVHGEVGDTGGKPRASTSSLALHSAGAGSKAEFAALVGELLGHTDTEDDALRLAIRWKARTLYGEN